MIWILILLGVVAAISVVITIWIYKKMSTDQMVSPLQGGSFIKEFREQFEDSESKSDSDKE